MKVMRRSAGNRTLRGTTLIEMLVALLVLSIGLLGVAALQMNSLQGNRGAHLRSQAAALAYDIADRMRANRDIALGGGYNIALGATPATGTTIEAIDLRAWKQALTNTLPAGDGSVALAGSVVLVTITWTDSVGSERFTTRTQI